MRYALPALAIVVLVGLHQGWFAQAYDRAITAALTEEARLAIDLRCRGEDGDDRAVRECRRVLRKLYLAGSLDPDKTLRFYCDSIKTAWWGGERPVPPEVCVRRYGGWR